ncbi:MAG: polysaccharide biosynthesis/export family protein [Aureliella sp.]
MTRHKILMKAALTLGAFWATMAATASGQTPSLQPPAKTAPQTTQDSMTPTAPVPPAPLDWQLPITYDKCGYTACNLPPQPTVAGGGCQPCMTAIDCADSPFPQRWCDARAYNFQPLRQGEHLGPVRLPSTQDYRLRVGDRLRFVYSASQSMQSSQYRLMVGDELLIESLTDDSIKQGDLATRGTQIQPDGFLYMKLIGMVRAEGLTIPQLRRNLEIAYRDKIINPAIDVTPVRTNVKLTSIMASVDNRGGAGGQVFPDFVHQDGTVRLPSIGAVCVLGLTLDEVKREINLRYSQEVWGLEVEPIIDQEASHFVYVYGEVNRPDRYQLNGPTSVTQALAMAQGIKLGGNARQIVIFRRAEDWRMLATRIDIRGEVLGKVPTPADEIWLRDSDLIVVPPTPIKLFDNFVRQVFTDGIYGIVPFNGFSITRFQQASIQ